MMEYILGKYLRNIKVSQNTLQYQKVTSSNMNLQLDLSNTILL